MTTRPHGWKTPFEPSDPDGWYDPDGTAAAMLKQVREAGEYRRSDPPERAMLDEVVRRLGRAGPPEPPDANPLPADGWRAIESAPKDTPILLWHGAHKYQQVGLFVSKRQRWEDAWAGEPVYADITHWMPLPSPPAEETKTMSAPIGLSFVQKLQARIAEFEAALTEIANSGAQQHDFAIPADHVTWTIHRARAALSGEGVTK